MSVKITYLDHSGFSVETESCLLVFDDVKGEWPKIKKQIVFVSHSHRDHFSPDIYAQGDENVEYVLPWRGISKKWRGFRIRPLESICVYEAGDVKVDVRAFGSTDEGVSYWAFVEGISVFHAGDLNWWHWQDESTESERAKSEQAFKSIIETLPKQERLDIAFFPVDPRLGTNHDAGARYFIEQIKPRVFVPMHFWKNAQAALDFAKLSNDVTRIVPLTEHMQEFVI